MLIRFTVLCLLILDLTLTPLTAASSEVPERNLRIGYQKYSAAYLLKLTGDLEKRLAPLHVHIVWSEFQYGVPMLEALNAGQIDFATTGETPPVIAQALRDSELIYVGQEPASPRSEAILVPSDSKIGSVKDLRGQRVAVAKGANAHYLLLKALQQAGLTPKDIQWVFLPPGDAAAAFQNHRVDAWAIWDFQRALIERSTGAKVLTDGVGLVENYECYTSRASFVADNGDLVRLVIEELARIDGWITGHSEEATRILSSELGVDAAGIRLAYSRRNFGASVPTLALRDNQRRIADLLFASGLIPSPINVDKAFPNLH